MRPGVERRVCRLPKLRSSSGQRRGSAPRVTGACSSRSSEASPPPDPECDQVTYDRRCRQGMTGTAGGRMGISVNPLTPTIGAEISGVDLRDELDESVTDEIRD